MGRKDTHELYLPEGEDFPEDGLSDEDFLDEEFTEDDLTEVADSEDEEEEKAEAPPKRRRKKRKKKRYLLKFFIFCLVVSGGITFMFSDYFKVEKILIEGNVNYTAEEILALSGAKPGKNLFKVDKGKIVDNLLKDSYLETAKVVRKPPNTIVIKVVERKEMAAIPYGEEFIIIDNSGYVLNRVEEEPQLTQLLGLNIKTMDRGQIIQVKKEEMLRDTLDMLKTMEYSDLFFKKIDMTNVVIKAYIYDNLICKGTPENILTNMKNGNLETILYDLYKKEITKGVIHVGDDQYCSFSPNIE